MHGAWHDESCWSEVQRSLAAEHLLSSVPVHLPSTDPESSPGHPSGGPRGRPALPGFADDVAAVIQTLEATPGPVTLCGHGYAGMVISEAGNHPRVNRLVYLSAYCPVQGQRISDLLCALGPWGGAPPIRDSGDGRMWFSRRAAPRRLYGDLPVDVARRLADRLLPSSSVIHDARATAPAWRNTVTTFVHGRRDRVMAVRRSLLTAQRVLQSHLAAGRPETTTLTLAGGHCLFYSQPQRVAEILARGR
ncbi:MAG: alpha/beta hydrolase [Actinomycetota bacterium]